MIDLLETVRDAQQERVPHLSAMGYESAVISSSITPIYVQQLRPAASILWIASIREPSTVVSKTRTTWRLVISGATTALRSTIKTEAKRKRLRHGSLHLGRTPRN
jgi:hypothetical protein